MISKLPIYFVNGFTIAFAAATLWFCLHVVWNYIIKDNICRKFINLFYIAAIPLLLSNIAFGITIFIKLPQVSTEEQQ